MPAFLAVAERGVRLEFTFEDLLRYHGPGSPGGVAHAFKVLERALPLLSPDAPAERRQITVSTAFGGPGARDGLELVTRAVTDGRFTLDPELARPQLGWAAERFVFRLGHRGRAVTLWVRDGFVPEELIALARREAREPDEELRFAELKRAMARRVMASPAQDVYDAQLVAPADPPGDGGGGGPEPPAAGPRQGAERRRL